MRTLHVVVGFKDSGEEVVDVLRGDELSFITEPSGVLSILRGDEVWTAFAPGAWMIVRDPPPDEEDES